jgi:hypothetical protein
VFRLITFSSRANCALGAAARSADPEPLLNVAADCAAELGSQDLPASEPFAHLIRGGIAELRGQAEAAIEHYTKAMTLFEPLNAVNASIAGARRGRLLGAEEGCELIARAHAVLAAQGIKNPDRWMRMVTPAALRD